MEQIYECKRCGCVFDEKRYLVKHLKKKLECICINSLISRDELINNLMDKDGISCQECGKTYSTIYYMKKHKCKKTNIDLKNESRKELEDKIKHLQNELKMVIQQDKVSSQKSSLVKSIDGIGVIDNSKNIVKNINSNNTIHNTQNITVIINDIDDPKSIQYILKDQNFAEKILKWVTDKKNGLIKYMNERFYNPQRPENHGIRRVDKQHIEIHTLGQWIKYENTKALELIISNLGIDMDTIITILKYDYYDDYDNNKTELIEFKREVGDPLDMDLDITDDESTGEKIQQIEQVNNSYILKDVKSDKLENKCKKWKERISREVL